MKPLATWIDLAWFTTRLTFDAVRHNVRAYQRGPLQVSPRDPPRCARELLRFSDLPDAHAANSPRFDATATID